YFIGRYYAARRLRDLVFVSGLTSAGLLTKFNFFFYAVWLFVVPAAIECYRVVRGHQSLAATLRFVAMTVGVPLVLAGPWYLAHAAGPMSPLGLLGNQVAAGISVAGLTPVLLFFPVYWNYSTFVTTLGITALLIYLGFVVRLPILRSA